MGVGQNVLIVPLFVVEDSSKIPKLFSLPQLVIGILVKVARFGK